MKTKLLLLLLVLAMTRMIGQNFYKINFAGNPQNVFVQNITQSKSVSLPGTDTLILKFKGTSVLETGCEHQNLTIYPNPMDQSCSFDFENMKPGKVIIQVFNANGSLIHKYSSKLPQGIQHFQLSGVPSGIYVIDIKTITGHYSGSFVSTDKSNTAFLLMNNRNSQEETVEDKKTNSYNNSDITNIPLEYRNTVELDFATGDQLMFVGYSNGFENDTVYASPTGDQTITFTFCAKPAQPSAISGNNYPCQNSTGLIYSVTNVTGVNYSWTVPSDWSITSGQGSNSITVTGGTLAGSITVTPSNTCGIGPANTLAVTTQVVTSNPTVGTNISSQSLILWNWNTAAGASGYKYNTVNNYSTATDNETSTTYMQSGLICNTAYTLYIWAYNTCGTSSVLQLSQTTSACSSGCDSVTFTYNGSTVTYGSVTSAGGRCWLDRNLGATQVATGSSDSAAYGDLFQWGRLDDGHQVRTSATTTTMSSNNVPNHNNFIVGMRYPGDWRAPQNANLWQGVIGINNPCPTGYRPPTDIEWTTELASWDTQNAAGAFDSPLKLTKAGYRYYYDGTVYSDSWGGIYWSSTVYNIASRFLGFDNENADMLSNERAYGMSVRCIKD